MEIQPTLDQLYRLERFGIKLGLDSIRKLLSLMGNPHEAFPAVHVTGSNGKGSVCAYIASALQEAGYRVGLYTSPHLIRFNERIQVDGKVIPDEDILRLWRGMQPAIRSRGETDRTHRPTFFEVTTAMAFEYFREREVDLAVVEVGMGGSLDATNVVDGKVAVITRVALEHTERLGRSVKRIAKEKAGIIKDGARAVTVEQDAAAVIAARCREVGASLVVLGRDIHAVRMSQDLGGQRVRVSGPFGVLELSTPLLGDFQVENLGLAVAALMELRATGWKLPDEAIASGIQAARWPGRLQVVRQHPLVLVDGAHNGPAAQALASSVSALVPGSRLRLVIGVLDDKDLGAFAASLGPLASRVFACQPRTYRAYAPEEIVAVFRSQTPAQVVPTVGGAIDAALAGAAPDDLVLITGSIYTAGEALEHFRIRS